MSVSQHSIRWPSALRRIVAAPAILVAGLLLTACQEQRSVSIAALLPLSGPAAYVGEEVRDGLILAIEEINQRGGIGGHPAELVIGDTSDPARTIDDVYAAATASDPLFVVTGTSAAGLAVKPLAEADERPMFGLVATAPELTQDSRWVYRYWISAHEEVPPIAHSLPAASGLRVGVAYLDDPFGRTIFEEVRHHVDGDTTGLLLGQPFALGESDFARVVAPLVDRDRLILVGFDSHLRALLQAIREVQYAGQTVMVTTGSLPTVTALPEADGIHVTAPAIYNQAFDFAAGTARRYENRFDRPFSHYAANAYDLAILVSQALEGQEPTRESLTAFLAGGFTFSGVFGTVTLAAGGHDFGFPLFAGTIRDGRIVYQ